MGGLTARFGMELGVTLPLKPPLRKINIQYTVGVTLVVTHFEHIYLSFSALIALKFLCSDTPCGYRFEMLIHNIVKSLISCCNRRDKTCLVSTISYYYIIALNKVVTLEVM